MAGRTPAGPARCRLCSSNFLLFHAAVLSDHLLMSGLASGGYPPMPAIVIASRDACLLIEVQCHA
jgi:hypothetical protein